MSKRLLATSGCAVVLAFGVSGCGGGGGGVNTTPPPPPSASAPTPTPSPAPAPTPAPTPTPTPSAVNYDTTEYRASNYAVAANAITAYQSGATGKGVKIGVIDSGINPTLFDAGKIDPASKDVAGDRGVSDEDGHGTAVSAVAAAPRNGSNTLGVAFDATIVSMRADTPGSCAETGEDKGCSFADPAIAAGIDAARQAGAKVINLSLGGDPPNSAVLSAMNHAVNAGVVLVISAGNDGEEAKGANPDPFALIPAQQFAGRVIIAGSIGADNGAGGVDLDQISAFSNRAGTGANYYLTALGFRNRAPSTDGKQYQWSGTSFSAPTISGAAALMAQAFPNLTAAQIVDILFRSADDLGTAGTDSIFGRGRLNVATAFSPIGSTSLPGSQTAISTSFNGDMPAAAGDAGTAASAGVIILDGYSRAFALRLGATLRTAQQSQPLRHALQGNARVGGATAGPLSVAMTVTERPDLPRGYALDRLGIGPEDARRSRLIAGSAIARLDRKTALAFGISESAKSIERRLSGAESGAFLVAKDGAGELGFAARRGGSMAVRRQLGATGITMSGENGDVWQEHRTSATGSPYRLVSVSADRRLGSNWMSLGLSRLSERQTLLGGRISQALGGGGSNSMFVDAEARRDFGGGWSSGLSARRGWTSFAAGKFQTSAYGFDVRKLGVLGGKDRLGFRLSQPLRVEKGGFAMLLPTAYNYDTGLATNSLTRMSLTPSGRETDAELSYGSSLFGDAGWLGGNLFYRRQPGHVATADADVGGAVRFSLSF